MAKTQAADYANFMAYTAYNLGASVPIGIARTALALYNLAKLYFYQESYRNYEASKSGVREDKEAEASRDTRRARRGVKKAKGAEKLTAGAKAFIAGAKEAATKFGDAVEDLVDDVTGTVAQASLDTMQDQWKAQLYRGLAEMIPVIGSAYCTYTDFKDVNKISKVDLFGRQELDELMSVQRGFDQEAKGVFAR